MASQIGREVKVPLPANTTAGIGDNIEIVKDGKVVAVATILKWLVGGGAVVVALAKIVAGGL